MFFTWLKLSSSILFLINPTFDMKLLLEELSARCCGVVVITSALHAEGVQFKPGQHQGKFLTKRCFFTWLKLRSSILFLINPIFDMKLLLEELIARCCGVVVITSALHAEALQFKPGQHQGKFLTKRCFFTRLKLRSSILFLVNPTFDRKLLLKD